MIVMDEASFSVNVTYDELSVLTFTAVYAFHNIISV